MFAVATDMASFWNAGHTAWAFVRTCRMWCGWNFFL